MNFMTSADVIVGLTIGGPLIAGWGLSTILKDDRKIPKRPELPTRIGRRIEETARLDKR